MNVAGIAKVFCGAVDQSGRCWTQEQADALHALRRFDNLLDEKRMAEEIHDATGLNLRCCTDAARAIIAKYEANEQRLSASKEASK